jgi:hypothetical protein
MECARLSRRGRIGNSAKSQCFRGDIPGGDIHRRERDRRTTPPRQKRVEPRCRTCSNHCLCALAWGLRGEDRRTMRHAESRFLHAIQTQVNRCAFQKVADFVGEVRKMWAGIGGNCIAGEVAERPVRAKRPSESSPAGRAMVAGGAVRTGFGGPSQPPEANSLSRFARLRANDRCVLQQRRPPSAGRNAVRKSGCCGRLPVASSAHQSMGLAAPPATIARTLCGRQRRGERIAR